MTTEKVTTSDELQKSTEKITTGEEVVKGNDKVQKRTENITTHEEMKTYWKIGRYERGSGHNSKGRIHISLRVSIKDIHNGLILIIIFLKKNSTLEPEFYKNKYRGYWRSRHRIV